MINFGKLSRQSKENLPVQITVKIIQQNIHRIQLEQNI